MYFIRKWKVKIDAFETTELRVKFEVDKSLVGSPNLMKLEIYNIKESNRNLIKEVYQNIELYAGYVDSMPLIFKGQLRTVSHLLVGVDWITTIYAADGALALENAKINKTYPAGTTQETLVDSLIGELSSVGGIAKGKLEGIKECITKKKSLLKSMIMSGGVKEWLDELSKTCGFDYSVNDGVIDTNTKDKPLNDEPMFLISQKTGMIGSPEITEVGASVSVYLKGDLKLARRFKINAISATLNIGNQYFRKVKKSVNDNPYMIQQIKHLGDSHENDWKTELTGIIY